MRDRDSLSNKTVLVTGGTHGIGQATVERLAEHGACVISAALDAEPRAEIVPAPGSVWPFRFDVREESQVLALFAWIDRHFPTLDAIVCCAGIGVFKPLVELSLGEWTQVFQVNVAGLFLCCREAVRRMVGRGGRIINIGSIADYLPLPGNGAYGASKAAVRMLTQIINEENKLQGIHATLLSPGAVYTDIWRGRPEFAPSDMLSTKDIADTVLDILRRPANVRIDEVRILPQRGVL